MPLLALAYPFFLQNLFVTDKKWSTINTLLISSNLNFTCLLSYDLATCCFGFIEQENEYLVGSVFCLSNLGRDTWLKVLARFHKIMQNNE